jgi:hypothetical protein
VGALLDIQVSPESAEKYMPPLTATATNLVASAEEATEFHCLFGALLKFHVLPAFVEVYIFEVVLTANL